MPYEQKPNTGALFQNEKGADNHPDMKGNLNVNGVEFEIAAWKRVSKRGQEFLSISVKPKRERREPF